MELEQLSQIRAIEQLKYRYMRAVDTKDWDLLTGTLAPDVTAVYGKRLSFDNRDDLVATLSRAMTHSTTVHRLHHPEIVLDGTGAGDRATGTWLLTDLVIRKQANSVIEGAAHYSDDYRREPDGGWVIARTGYERLYESETSLDDLPSFTLHSDRFAG